MELGEHMKAWRKRLDWPQTKAAVALDVPLKTLQAIEQGRPFRYDLMLRLAAKAIEGEHHGRP